MAAEIEGHPDNVALVLYGVIQLENRTGDSQLTVRSPMRLRYTRRYRQEITARGVLSGAVFNIGRVAWLISELASNVIDQLRYGVTDTPHQAKRGAAVYLNQGSRGRWSQRSLSEWCFFNSNGNHQRCVSRYLHA